MKNTIIKYISIYLLMLIIVTSCRTTSSIKSMPHYGDFDTLLIKDFDVYVKYDYINNSCKSKHYTKSLVDNKVILGVHYLFIEKNTNKENIKVYHCTPIHFYHRFKFTLKNIFRRNDPNFNDAIHYSRNKINIREMLELRQGILENNRFIKFQHSCNDSIIWELIIPNDKSIINLHSITSASFKKKNKGSSIVFIDNVLSTPITYNRIVDPLLVFATPGKEPIILSDIFYITNWQDFNNAYFPTKKNDEVKVLYNRVIRNRL